MDKGSSRDKERSKNHYHHDRSSSRRDSHSHRTRDERDARVTESHRHRPSKDYDENSFNENGDRDRVRDRKNHREREKSNEREKSVDKYDSRRYREKSLEKYESRRSCEKSLDKYDHREKSLEKYDHRRSVEREYDHRRSHEREKSLDRVNGKDRSRREASREKGKRRHFEDVEGDEDSYAQRESERGSKKHASEDGVRDKQRSRDNDRGNHVHKDEQLDSSRKRKREREGDGDAECEARPNADSDVQQGHVVPKESQKTPAGSEFPTNTKVSTVLTTNVVETNIVRSDEVTGKPSTDGTSSTATKGANFSLDAIAKAKKALQMQKELSEKLKKLPQMKRATGSSSAATSTGQSNEALGSSSIKTEPSVLPSTSSATSSSVLKSTTGISMNNATSQMAAGITNVTSGIANLEAVKRAQELAAKLGFRQDPEFMPLLSMFPNQTPEQSASTAQPKPAKAPVLRLDAQGREIDEHGNVIDKPKVTNISTLKVNINKQKKEAFQIIRPEFEEDPASNPHFDPQMGVNKVKLMRPKRNFQFVEEGRWSKQAEIMKFKNQFGEAQARELKIKQAQLTKAKAESDINPNLIEVSERVPMKEVKQKDPIPDVEWWDIILLPSGSYSDVTDAEIQINTKRIKDLVEHPQPIEPPAEPTPPPPQPLKLTKKEQKKLRTQRRLAKEKDRQEMIRQGLLEPPKPKVKMSNLMRVLGAQATQDPTRLEMEIRSAAAEREQAHVDRNIARKLTPTERREKKEKKLFDDPNTVETIVAVYKINDLSHPQTRFKVDINAQENRLTGCAIMSDSMTVVVVEGCSKSIKRYRKLMLNRINWAAAVVKAEEDMEDDDDRPSNKCVLVWQGSVAKPTFNKFMIQQCRTEAAARKYFADAGVGHYWDLAANMPDDQIL